MACYIKISHLLATKISCLALAVFSEEPAAAVAGGDYDGSAAAVTGGGDGAAS